MAVQSLNTAQIREKFPALRHECSFLDNAGGSQVLGACTDMIVRYMVDANVQPVASTYSIEKSSTDMVTAGYRAAARFLNAEEDEIAFGGSATQLFRTLSQAMMFQPGDEIVLSSLEHEANIAPWVDIAQRQNLLLKWWHPNPCSNPKLTLDDLRILLSNKTKLVAFTHGNNILGTITDVKAITDIVHAVPGAIVCVDGVAYAPHRPVDVHELGVDFYTISWYKVFGPHCATMYASRSAQEQLQPLGHFFNPTKSLRDKITFGSGGYELICSIPAVVDYLLPRDHNMWQSIFQHEASLQRCFLQYLTTRSDVTIYGERSDDPSLRLPIISFTIRGWSSQELVSRLLEDKTLGLRAGNFYAVRLMDETLRISSTDGVVRISLLHYNTTEELQRVIRGLEKLRTVS